MHRQSSVEQHHVTTLTGYHAGLLLGAYATMEFQATSQGTLETSGLLDSGLLDSGLLDSDHPPALGPNLGNIRSQACAQNS